MSVGSDTIRRALTTCYLAEILTESKIALFILKTNRLPAFATFVLKCLQAFDLPQAPLANYGP